MIGGLWRGLTGCRSAEKHQSKAPPHPRGGALGVSQATISGDLRNLSTVDKLKPAKTASNPKGAGRPISRRLTKSPANQGRTDRKYMSKIDNPKW